ncbi:MAG: endonuclease MutS2, partial [Eubacteriales bacterium]|nr:endonuclease MutS2 [Eubacteriales bacterium]
ALEPSSDMEAVTRLQEETDDAVKVILEHGLLPLGGISDIRAAVSRAAAGSQLNCPDFLRIGALLRTVDRLRGRLSADPPVRVLDRMISQLQPDNAFAARIDDTIAGEDELHDRASPQLMNLRRRIREAQNDVKESLNRIVRSQGRALQEQLVTMRGDRYVVPVKAEYRGEIPGLVHDTSSSGATLFVEPLPVVALNNKIRELMSLEREEIDRILLELSDCVAGRADLLRNDLALCARIDFIMARGRLALEMRAMRPQLNATGRIRLLDARHPLIPKDRVVPIYFELGVSFKTLVITGPNTGGKTVALKTCGLFCLMAMAGLQIPARDGSEISVFDQVLADIGDEQSIEQDLSTFSAHMHNLVEIANLAGPGTLVLADELGSGTDPSEGAALAIAILDHLRRRGCLTVATTHYKELKGYALQTESVENACCEFDAKTLRPTYRLLIGVPGVSNAFAISRRLGLDDKIIEQAQGLLSEEGIRFEDLVRKMEESRSQADEAYRQASALRAQAVHDAAQIRQHKEALEEQKRQMIREARQEARELYADALQEVERLLSEIRSGVKAQELAESHRLATQVRQETRAGLKQVDGHITQSALSAGGRKLRRDEIHPGQTYSAPALGMTGKLLEGPDSRDICVLQNGAMKVSVPLDALRLPDLSASAGTVRTKRRSSPKSLTMERHLNMQSEIQLLGQTVEEATANLDKFLDDAVLGGIQTVRVVHGKGTGALRSAVQQKLRQDPRVRTYRLGVYGEGDSGVTIAELK